MTVRGVGRLVSIAFLTTLAAGATAAEHGEVGMSFVPNLGQVGLETAWLAHAPGASVAFSARRVSLALPAHGRTVSLQFFGTAGPAGFEGLEPLPGKANYFLGADPSSWRSDVPTFGALVLHELYQGVDLRFEGSETVLKGTFVLAPGADPSRIRWRYSGVDAVRGQATGDLILVAGNTRLEETAPVAWQDRNGERVPVEARYRLADDGKVGFAVGEYDPALPLVIDPYLEFATLVGGGKGDEGRDIVVDAQGNAYVTGSTLSADFPGAGPPQATYAGPVNPSNLGDAFVFKLAPDGKTVLFMTYLGGAGQDVADAIALDPQGNIVIAGSTESTNFPTSNPIQAAQGGQSCSSGPCNDLFIAKLASAGNALVFSTYLGGSRDESAGLVDFGTRLNSMGVDVDDAGSIYVAGTSDSDDFPVVNGYQGSRAGLSDIVLVKLPSDGSQILYSTYLGGSGAEYSGDVAVDNAGRAWLVGGTLSSNFPTRSAFDTSRDGSSDAVAAKLDTTKIGSSSLIYSTYLGGSDSDQAFGAGIDADRNVYVTGWTGSSDFPLANAYQTTNASEAEPQPRDGFVTVLADDGRTLVYSTYFGGSARDVAYDLDVGADKTVVIAGPTQSDDLPLRLPYQSYRSDGIDLFVARLDPWQAGASSLIYSTYLGGTDSDVLYGVADGPDGSVFVTGATAGIVSDTFPIGTTIGPNATGDGVIVAKLMSRAQSWVLVGSRANGANSSIWRTDLGLFNPEAGTAHVEVRFHGVSGITSSTWEVLPGGQLILEDVVGLLGGSGNGALEVLTDREIKVTSRTYNLVAAAAACYAGGTLGQGFGSWPSRDTLLAGESAWLPQLVETAAYRTNISFTNTGAAHVRLTLRLYDETGRLLATSTVELEPGQWTQQDRAFFQLAGRSDIVRGYAKVTVEEGSGVIVVGSVVDNITNDPTTIPMVKVDGAGATTSWVLVGSHANGANDSRWRTDLGILNVSSGQATVTVRVHAPGGVLEASFTVGSGDQSILTDVVGMVSFSGSAAIEVVSDRPVVVSSRTYNQVAAGQPCFANGTLGQGLDGYPAGSGLSAGQSAWLTELTENAAYRTNISLTNTGDTSATVTVRLFNAEGAEVASFVVTLAPGEWKQDNRSFYARAGLTDVGAGYARVTVESGSGVLAIGSVVNNVTNDPTTIAPVL